MKILCPCCLKINPLEKSSFKYGEFECRFANCSKISSIANCLHCMRINYFNLGQIKKDFVPFIPEITQLKLRNLICKDMYGNNLTNNCTSEANEKEINLKNKELTIHVQGRKSK